MKSELVVKHVFNQIQQKLLPDLNYLMKRSLHKCIFFKCVNTREQYFTKYENYTYSTYNKYYTRNITSSRNDLKLSSYLKIV